MCCLFCGRVWESVYCLLVFEVEIPWSDGDGAEEYYFLCMLQASYLLVAGMSGLNAYMYV